ncbi:MAG: glycoside hydrolase family 3 C-terminal domain-containing protein [Verrucomicrobiota bacterium]|jgi:beta-glucosidase
MKTNLCFIFCSLLFICPGTTRIRAQTVADVGAQAVLAQDTKGTPDERADQLAAELTFAEKVSLLSGGPGGYSSRAIPRLGIPSFWMSDGPNGVRNVPQGVTPQACAFPAGAALAATWDPGMATAYGTAIGLEDRARGTCFQLGPGVNICRVPVNGRNFEYFGEDPCLASIMAANWVKACSAQGSIPTIKHFACNNQELNRGTVDAEVDERTLHEIYLPAFQKAVTEGGVVAVMCSYNRLNGLHASANDWLLNQVLKGEWGFQGLVMSDWGASHATTDVARGLDLEMPAGQNLKLASIQAAITNGTVSTTNVDNAVHRILRSCFAAGWLDAGWKPVNPDLPMDSPASAKTALAIAEEAIVLLKNDHGVLPLDRAKVKTIVVVGPNAWSPDGVVPANIGGGGSGEVNPFPDRIPEARYLDGITKAAGGNVKVIHLSMPEPTEEQALAPLAGARTSPSGEPGLTLSVEVADGNAPVQIAPSVQQNINVTWQQGQLPFGVPANLDATFTWSGILTAPHDGDWQLAATPNAVVSIAGQTNAAGAILHLKANNPVPILITASLQANPPVGRGRRGGGPRGGSGNARVLRVALTDLAFLKSADAVIACVGLNRGVESEGRDRPFELPEVQQQLIRSVTALNPRVIVINNSGAGVGMSAWAGRVPAILQAWYLGQEGGIAIGEVLFGDVNPSGHLISTFDKRFEDNPAFAYYPGKRVSGIDYPVEPYTEGLFYGYRGYDKAHKNPMFPFGFGLSYTTFKVGSLKVAQAGTGVQVSMEVKNTGSRPGTEVVQIYVGERKCPEPRPLRELKGFSRVMLDPGETKHVEITLPRDAFAYWSSTTRDWKVDAGNRFTIGVGVSERDIRAQKTLEVF